MLYHEVINPLYVLLRIQPSKAYLLDLTYYFPLYQLYIPQHQPKRQHRRTNRKVHSHINLCYDGRNLSAPTVIARVLEVEGNFFHAANEHTFTRLL